MHVSQDIYLNFCLLFQDLQLKCTLKLPNNSFLPFLNSHVPLISSKTLDKYTGSSSMQPSEKQRAT